MTVFIGSVDSHEKTHKELLKYFYSMNKVDSISDVLEAPNRYGENVSYYTIKYNLKDRYNYSRKDFNINYDKKVVFVSNEGYFPYKNISDIKKIVSKFIK